MSAGPTDEPAAMRVGGTAVAALVVAVVAMMVVPLPTWLLDILLASNLALSAVVLLAAASARSALALASFPTLLVLTTLYRVALNVSTVRLILLQADAGRVVSAFGGFVVRGDTVVGFAVFLVITIVQYVVIARGAERVAEVAARFTLDALPGRQLSIDADLRAGAIDAEQARSRRADLSREAHVYGALDGAMRFVKGDAIAALAILGVSLVGGLAVGVVERKLALGDALRLYTLLTVGDGLVSQIPALLLATAAGLLVTRAGAVDDVAPGEAIVRELFGRPRALALVAALLVGLGLVPGLPLVPLVVVALPLGIAAAVVASRKPTAADTPALDPESDPPVELALDPALAAAHPSLDLDVDGAARRVVEELGVPLPKVACTVDKALPPRGFEVRLRGVPLTDGTIPDGRVLAPLGARRLAAVAPAQALGPVESAQETRHPATGAPAVWVPASSAAALAAAGVTVLDARACLVGALEGTLRRHAHELLGFDETGRLVAALARRHPALVREVERRLDAATLTGVLRRLVAEGVSVRDLRDVLEALATAPAGETDATTLTERVRAAMKRHITHRLSRGKQIDALVLDPLVEDAVREAIRPTQTGPVLALEPALAADILDALARALESVAEARPVVVTSAELRRHVRRLVEGEHPDLPVVTWQELTPDVRVETVARVAV